VDNCAQPRKHRAKSQFSRSHTQKHTAPEKRRVCFCKKLLQSSLFQRMSSGQNTRLNDGLTLAGLETRIGFIDHIETTTTANHTIVAMTAAQ